MLDCLICYFGYKYLSVSCFMCLISSLRQQVSIAGLCVLCSLHGQVAIGGLCVICSWLLQVALPVRLFDLLSAREGMIAVFRRG
jgi:hypothetical protein